LCLRIACELMEKFVFWLGSLLPVICRSSRFVVEIHAQFRGSPGNFVSFFDGGGDLSLIFLMEILFFISRIFVILDNHTVSRLDHEYFLPIDLISSDEKILKVLNLLGLYVQKDKHLHWLIPTLLSLTSVVMGLCSTLRRCVYSGINTLSQGAVHFLCDHLNDFSWRRQAYSLGNWIDNLKPNNDLQSKVMRSDIRALIVGGARVNNGKKHYDNAFHGAIRLPDNDEATLNDIEFKFNQGGNGVNSSFDCGTFSIDYAFHSANGSLEEGAQINGKCLLEAGKVASINVDCNSEEAKTLFKFAYHMAHSQS
ncbi:hypothetical protein KI387_037268, partial [Taxus chinensis]